MILKGIEFKNFRNYEHLELELSPGENLFVGGNAQGKSNLLEGVYFLAHLRSNRSPRIRELVLEGSQRASVRGLIIDGESRLNVGVSFGKTGRNVEVNGQRVESAAKVRGLVKCVMFSPEDLYIVRGDPSRRREFMDETMEGIGASAAHAILNYKHLLRQRNAVLRSLEKSGGDRRRYLEPWDETLSKAGSEIVAERVKIVNELETGLAEAYQEVAREKVEVGIKYKCSFEAEGPVSTLKERMREGLEENASVEERTGTTIIGPHRDDVEIRLQGRDARFSASQGEQRTIAFCLRMVQRGYLEKVTGKAPILMLDDVLSELDAVRRRGVLAVAAPGSQVLVTTTELPEGVLSGEAKIFRVKSGRAEVE